MVINFHVELRGADVVLCIANEEGVSPWPDKRCKQYVTAGCIGRQFDFGGYSHIEVIAHVTPKYPDPTFTLWRCDTHEQTLKLEHILSIRTGTAKLHLSEAFDYRIECTSPSEQEFTNPTE